MTNWERTGERKRKIIPAEKMCERLLNGWANQLAFEFKWREAEMEGFWSIVIELAAHSVLILSLSCSYSRDSLRLHLNWTLPLVCIHNIFATEITIEKKTHKKKIGNLFLWSGQELFFHTLYFFSLSSVIRFFVCRLVVQWLRGWYAFLAFLWFLCYFFPPSQFPL